MLLCCSFPGLSQHLAHGTSLAAILPTAMSSSSTYFMEGQVNWVAAGVIALFGMMASPVGVKLSASIPGLYVLSFFKKKFYVL